MLEKKYVRITESIKSRGLFWRAASVSLAVLSSPVRNTILQSEAGSSKKHRDKAEENRASASSP